ncbi:MAG: hypothetical protein HWN79_02740 [Candidatus Lokiarchaeota archaeon]|nr:hypothetical protein [Candidatus Lokiarchaeota archaeon]
MKKNRNLDWGNFRHPEFLQTLNISVNELKFIKMFLKRGSVELVNEILRERKSKKQNVHKDDLTNRYYKVEKI